MCDIFFRSDCLAIKWNVWDVFSWSVDPWINCPQMVIEGKQDQNDNAQTILSDLAHRIYS